LSCRFSFTDLAAKLTEACVKIVGSLTDAVFDLGLVIRAEEILLLPSVGFFADVEDLHGDDVPTLGSAAIEEIAIEEFRFGPQMVLSHRLGIGDK
jgi:hypothetical protein